MKQIILGLIISLWFCGFCAAQQDVVPSYEGTLANYEDLFSVEEALHLTLKMNVQAFKKNRDQDVFHEAEMTHGQSENNQVSKTVRVKAGGNLRLAYCSMPPLLIHMETGGMNIDSPQDQLMMLMVVPCKNKSLFESYVLREYLAYKLYNIISPFSYRVRLVRLSLIDTGKDHEVTEEWAFLQEPDELLSLRLKAILIKNDKLSMKTVNPEIINSLSMFQYMIGNTDYSVTGQHNIRILALKEYSPTGFIPVPCDFDFSGLVNADYAVPNEVLGTYSVRERYYLGPCRPTQVHEKTIQDLAQYKERIMEYLEDFKYLDDNEKADMIEYLKSYFKESSKSSFIENKITTSCR